MLRLDGGSAREPPRGKAGRSSAYRVIDIYAEPVYATTGRWFPAGDFARRSGKVANWSMLRLDGVSARASPRGETGRPSAYQTIDSDIELVYATTGRWPSAMDIARISGKVACGCAGLVI